MAERRPNILFINADQFSLNTLSSMGCAGTSTPALDELAAGGTFFRQSYTPYPVCVAARASWWTGRMPSETGVFEKRPSGKKALRADLPMLGPWLRDAGYETYHAGKWHAPELVTSRHDQIPGFYSLTTVIDDQGFVMDPHVAMTCEAFLRNRESNSPFFFVASFMNPHDICEWLFMNTAVPDELPYPELTDRLPEPPANWNVIPDGEPEGVKRFRETLEPQVGYWTEPQYRYYLWSYYRHIEAIDAEVGRILRALRDTGLDENTVVVFTSDHGEGLGAHRMTHKAFPYDEVCKVPLIVRGPGLQQHAVDESSLVSGVDLFPTLCDLAGVAPPERLSGMSLRPALEGGALADRTFVPVELANGSAGLIRTDRYKYIRYDKGQAEMLFDLRQDPGEATNLISEPSAADVLAQHSALFDEWRSSLESPGAPTERTRKT